MSTTLILLCMTIILMILVFLGITNIIPPCDDDSSQTAEDYESGWHWTPLLGNNPGWFIKGLADLIKDSTFGLVDINPPWWFKDLTPRKGYACWPSSEAPLFYNIQFIAFLQFMTWLALGDTIPGSFNAFPAMAAIAGIVVFLRWIWLNGPWWWGFIPNLSRNGSVLCFLTQIFIVVLPFAPIIKRAIARVMHSTTNCSGILKAGNEMHLTPEQVAQAYGYKDVKKSPFNKCQEHTEPENILLNKTQMTELANMINTGKPKVENTQKGGNSKTENLYGWDKHIAKDKMANHHGVGLSMGDFVKLIKEKNSVKLKEEWMEFNIPVFDTGLFVGISDMFFIGVYLITLITSIVEDIVRWVSHLPSEPYLPSVPVSISMFWDPIPTYYAIGGHNESCSNIFYIIYLARLPLLIVTMLFLLLYLLTDLISIIKNNIWTLLLILMILVVLMILWMSSTALFAWLWSHVLVYIFYVAPMYIFNFVTGGLGWIFGGFFGEIGEIIKLFSSAVF